MISLVILVASIIISGLIFVEFTNFDPRLRKSIFIFAGAFIMGINLLRILPFCILESGEKAGFYLLTGFFLQFLFEKLSEGAEHGHAHAHQNAHTFFGWQVLAGLSLHSALEALPLHELSLRGAIIFHKYLLGIAAHHIPAALALVTIFSLSGFKKPFMRIALIIFAMATPLGYLIGQLFSGSQYTGMLLGIASGSLLHISTTVLYESDNQGHHHLDWKKMAMAFAGIGLAYFI